MMTHKAMLAHKFDKSRVDWNQAVYIQPKLDGVRCLFTKDGAYSRNHKQFMNEPLSVFTKQIIRFVS